MRKLGSLIVFFLVSPLFADTIKIGTDPWCPYNCQGSQNEGINIEVLREIFEPEGHKVVVEYLPWARAVRHLKHGKITNFTSAAKADCEECIYASTPTSLMQNTLFVRKSDDVTWQGLKTLEGKVLGAILDYTYGDPLTEYIKKYKSDHSRVQLTSGAQALKSNIGKLVRGRVDFTIDEGAVLSYRNFRWREPRRV